PLRPSPFAVAHPKFPTSHDPFGIQSSNPFGVQIPAAFTTSTSG
uniref:Uncharacterized protein n=1 Tax=Cucumis melo TaxID=3656 RepID=A0A9I9EGY9_CUCME